MALDLLFEYETGFSPETCFERGTLERVQKVVELKPHQIHVKDHVPEVFLFEETSTMNIRREVGIEETKWDSRVLYIIAFRKFVPITTLSCDEFLRAWCRVVVCRSFDSLEIQCTPQGYQS